MKKLVILVIVLIIRNTTHLLAAPPDSSYYKLGLRYKKITPDQNIVKKDIFKLALLSLYWDSTGNGFFKKPLAETYYEYNNGHYKAFLDSMATSKSFNGYNFNDFITTAAENSDLSLYLDSVIVHNIYNIKSAEQATGPATSFLERLKANLDVLLLGMTLAIALGIAWIAIKKKIGKNTKEKPDVAKDSSTTENSATNISEVVTIMNDYLGLRSQLHDTEKNNIDTLKRIQSTVTVYKKEVEERDKIIVALQTNITDLNNDKTTKSDRITELEEALTKSTNDTTTASQKNTELATELDKYEKLKATIEKAANQLYGNKPWEANMSNLLLSYFLLYDIDKIAQDRVSHAKNIQEFLGEKPDARSLDLQNRQNNITIIEFIEMLKKNNVKFPDGVNNLYFPEKVSKEAYKSF